MKKNILKAALSFALLAFLFSRTNIEELGEALSGVSLSTLLAVLALNILMVAINSVRWKVLLGVQGVEAPVSRLFSFYLTGIFFNNFLPGSVGGDVYRVSGISGSFEQKEMALSSVFMERVLGLVVLLPVSLAAFIIVFPSVAQMRLVVYSEAAMAVFFVLLAPFFRVGFVKSFHFMYNPFFRLFKRFELKEKAKNVYGGLSVFWDDKAAIVWASLLSVASRLVWIVACYALSSGMGHGLQPAVYFLLLPIIEFVRMFPVSINGLGVREGAFVLYFGAFGMGVSDALVFSLLVYAVFLVLGAAGGIIYGARGWLTEKT